MSIATVVTRGYGSFGSIAEVVTRGYFGGSSPAPPPVGGHERYHGIRPLTPAMLRKMERRAEKKARTKQAADVALPVNDADARQLLALQAAQARAEAKAAADAALVAAAERDRIERAETVRLAREKRQRDNRARALKLLLD